MSTGWENHEAAPIEFLHSRVLEHFHEFRKNKVGNDVIKVEMDGSELSRIITKAKTETYAKYPKQVSSDAILKSNL